MKPANIRNRIKEVAKAALISPTEEFFQRVEEELEKLINTEFLEKVRADLIKKPKEPKAAPAKPGPAA